MVRCRGGQNIDKLLQEIVEQTGLKLSDVDNRRGGTLE
jgi:hypothetical protein